MRIFAIVSRGSNPGAGAKTDFVLASAVGSLSDSEVAQNAAVSANTDVTPAVVALTAQSETIDIDARSGGTGVTKVFYTVGTDWAGRVTHHWVAANDHGFLTINPWGVGTTYFTFSDPVSYGGNIYRSLTNSNTGHQPDVSPSYWQLDNDAQARETAVRYANKVDTTPPAWDSTTNYAPGSKTHYGAANWFALVEVQSFIPPPGCYWQEQLFVIGTPPDWDAVTNYNAGDFVTTQPDGRWWSAYFANLNEDPRTNSTTTWGPDTIIVQESATKVGSNVTIEV